MIAYVWVHVGCLPQIHKQCCQQQDRIMNTKVCNGNTYTFCVCTTFHGNASHTCVQHHCMVVCVCLYVYDCICMLVCVWLYDNVGMMSWWRTQDHMQLVTTCHPTWLRLYQFMLIQISGKVPEGSNADTLFGSGGFPCRYLLRFWRIPVQISGQLLEGSCADTCWGSWPWFLYHCAAPLHACMCMIVYKAEAFKLLGDSAWVFLEIQLLVANSLRHKEYVMVKSLPSNHIQPMSRFSCPLPAGYRHKPVGLQLRDGSLGVVDSCTPGRGLSRPTQGIPIPGAVPRVCPEMECTVHRYDGEHDDRPVGFGILVLDASGKPKLWFIQDSLAWPQVDYLQGSH